MTWWRVEFNSNGKVLSCVQCKPASERTGSVIYTRGTSESNARTRAVCIRARIEKAERKRKYLSEGRCGQCGDPKDAALKSCARCLKRAGEYKARTMARHRGEEVPRLCKSTAMSETRADRERSVELRVLLEVRAAFRNPARVKNFDTYLTERIERVRPREGD